MATAAAAAAARGGGGGGGGGGAVQAVLALQETGAADARQAECAVCLKDFEAEEKLRTMPCDHSFHQACIFDWLRVSCVCPLCRHALSVERRGRRRRREHRDYVPIQQD